MSGRTSMQSPRSRLPRARDSLIGRDADLAAVAAALRASRLVTVTGPGGAGKTRLAAAVAASDAVRVLVPDGPVWIDLSDVADANLVADTIRSGLGVSEAVEVAVPDAILDAIRDARVLLCLDNCEQVVDAAAELVDRLLDACPGLLILATSREPLAVEGESLWPVAPLAVPDAAVRTAAQVRACPAGELFEARARATSPLFELTDADAAAAARLCRQTGGLPLAIELAAARVRVLSVTQIATGIEDVASVQGGRVRGAPARQHSLRATLDWSHELLSEPERIVFRRLGVFPGGFGLGAARAVAEVAPGFGGDVLDLLGRLVDRSLLDARPSGEQVRYRLLAPIRSYARRRLDEAAERESTGAAHLAFYAHLAEAVAPLLAGPRQVPELDRLEVEGNNLRAALEFAAQHPADVVEGMRLATSVWRLCALRGYYREGRRWLDWAATVEADAPAELRAQALLGSGSLAHLQCDYPAAVRRLEAALQAFRDLDDARGVATVLQVLGSVARERARYARAEALHRESLQVATAHGDELRVTRSHGYLGFVYWLQGRWDAAAQECRVALDGARRIGDDEGLVWSLLSLGVVARYQNQDESAAQLLGQARDLAARMGYREGLAWTAHQLGALALGRGTPGAEELLREALAGHRALGDRWRLASVLEDLAGCLAGRSQDQGAVALLSAAAQVRAQIGSEIAPCERAGHDVVEATLRSRMTAEDFARAWAHGQTAALDDLLTVAEPAATAAPGPGAADQFTAPAAAGRLRIRALGEANVWRGPQLLGPGDWGYGKPRDLLFLLVSSPPRSKADIGRALWPDLEGAALRNAFHTALRDLRRALGDPDWVRFTAGRYALDRTRDHWSDLEIFTEALDAARHAGPGEPAATHLLRAIQVYGGEFAAGLPDAAWLVERRTHLAQRYAKALAAAGRYLIGAGRIDAAIDVYQRAAAHDPLDETAHRHLIAALVRAGQHAQAARVYQQLAERLRDELGIAPAPETTAAYRQLHPAS